MTNYTILTKNETQLWNAKGADAASFRVTMKVSAISSGAKEILDASCKTVWVRAVD